MGIAYRDTREPMRMMCAAPQARSARVDTRRPRAASRGAACVALLAVLAQIALPHLHRWIASGHEGDRSGPTTALAIVIGGEQGAAAPCDDHAARDCATCQALAQTRSFLAPQVELPRPVVLSTATFDRRHAPRAPGRTVAHAPRSPPAAV